MRLRMALEPTADLQPMRHSPEVTVCAGTGSRVPGGVRWRRQQSCHRCGTARRHVPNAAAGRRRRGTAARCALEPAAETPPMRHSPKVCAGTGSRDAADAAQPEGMRRMWQQDAADEAQPRGVRWNRQQRRRRRGTASRCALNTAAETPPMRHSPKVCAGTGSRAAADAAQPRGVRCRMPDAASKRAEPMRCTHGEERGSGALSDEDKAHVESCLLTKRDWAHQDT